MDVGHGLPSPLCLALPLTFWLLVRRRLAGRSAPRFVEGPTEHRLAFGFFAFEPSHVYWHVTKDPLKLGNGISAPPCSHRTRPLRKPAPAAAEQVLSAKS